MSCVTRTTSNSYLDAPGASVLTRASEQAGRFGLTIVAPARQEQVSVQVFE